MTQGQDTPVRRLVEDILTEEGGDTIRLLLERMLNRLLEAEQTEHLQALPYERTEGRQGLRNGFRTRQMVTRLGQITLRVPRTRDGSSPQACSAVSSGASGPCNSVWLRCTSRACRRGW